MRNPQGLGELRVALFPNKETALGRVSQTPYPTPEILGIGCSIQF